MSTHVRTDRVLASAVPSHESVFDNAVVLLVDDHEANLMLLERILVNAGTRHVHRTSDPEAVVELYRRLRPDLVLLDLHMPGMDGLTVMDAMRDATQADDFVPVIVLTADATSMAREAALRAGATDFLTKPVDAMEVTLRARNVLHTRALHSRLQAHNAELRAEIAERDAAEREARMAASAKVRRLRAVLDVTRPGCSSSPSPSSPRAGSWATRRWRGSTRSRTSRPTCGSRRRPRSGSASSSSWPPCGSPSTSWRSCRWASCWR
jgi:CheY-like chemotaxis protein